MEALEMLLKTLNAREWEPWEIYRINALKGLDPDGIDPDSGMTNLERAQTEWQSSYYRTISEVLEYIDRKRAEELEHSRYGY